MLSVYFRNEGGYLQLRPSSNSRLTSTKKEKLEMPLPSLKTSLLTVSESTLVTFQAAGVSSVAQNANVNAAPPPQQNKIKKTQFLSFSREDRSSVFLLRATTITSVSTYGTSENRRFVNLTETMTTRTTKSYTDQNQAYACCARWLCMCVCM